MIRKESIEYVSAVMAIMTYLKNSPDPQYAFQALSRDINELLEKWMTENALSVGLDVSSPDEGFAKFKYATERFMEKHKGLKLLSSTQATSYMRMDLESYQERSNPKKIRYDPSLESALYNESFLEKVKGAFGERFWKETWEFTKDQCTNMNLTIPCFSYTPDFIVKSGGQWIAVIEHKVCGSKQKSTLAPMITNGRNQLLLQMMCSNVKYGMLAIKDEGDHYTVTPFTSEGPEMNDFATRYLNAPLTKAIVTKNIEEIMGEWWKQRNALPLAPPCSKKKAGRPTNEERARVAPAEGLAKRPPKSDRLRQNPKQKEFN